MAPPPPLLARLIILLLASAAVPAAPRILPVEYLYPPFNLTYFHFIDTNGVFLLSPNATFSAAVYNPAAQSSSDDSQSSRYFFSVLHSASRTPVWTATTAGSTILQSVVLSLSAAGLSLLDPSAAQPDPAWSTPPRLRASVAALRLLDTGELALIDRANATLWSSFQSPTDTLLPGELLRLGVSQQLTSSASDRDLSPGAYRLVLTPDDALLQWATTTTTFLTYWALSSDPAAVKDSSQPVAAMALNSSGLYLLAANGRDTVYRLLFFPNKQDDKAPRLLLLLKVDPSGRLRALALTADAAVPTVWAAPANDCDLPLPCPSLSLCTPGPGPGPRGNGNNNGSSSSTCMCPDALSLYSNNGGCAPADGSQLPTAFDGCAPPYSYVSLGAGIGYLPTKFALPDTAGDALPACRDLCSANCSCLGFFYRNSSRSCFLLRNQIGSVFSEDGAAGFGFIKTLLLRPPPSKHDDKGTLSLITIVFGIVLPTVAAVLISLLLYAMGAQWLRTRRQPHRLKKMKKGGGGSWFKLPAMLSSSRAASASSEAHEEDDVLIPGLPTRFTYAELEAATDGFKWQIGCGGFGTVFRGELPDRSTVAVKRMNAVVGSSQTQGRRREFLTEMAVIGNVHHVNLVKLRGFCAEEGAHKHKHKQQLLVYEYMNRGSLDHTLFRKTGAAALEWAARLRVCIGAARGLAYLHGGCDRKILHCDVKPENILLDDRGGVKIADFGLAKLMSPEQSGLFTTMRGTRGYLAPEWLMNAPITDKADVYSFGMVLLEMVSGSKNSSSYAYAYDWRRKQEEDLEEGEAEQQQQMAAAAASSEGNASCCYFPALAVELHQQGRYAELVDPRLAGHAVDVAQVARVVRVALCCLHEDAARRPSMSVVAAMLDGSMDAGEPRPELLRYLNMYGRGLVDLRQQAKGKQGDTSSSCSPPSCVSAQQLSGPR